MTAKIIATAFCLTLSVTAAEALPSHPLFTGDAVHEIRLAFKQADWWETLTANHQRDATEPEHLEASFQWSDVAFESIGVRLKGLSSYSVQGKKKPFRLKLNEFVEGQKINGAGSFSLRDFWNDPSFVREKVYCELAAAAGLTAPRANFAALYISGESRGLYSLGEVVNDDFLHTQLYFRPSGGKAQILDRMETLRRLISPWVATNPKKLVTLEQFDKAMSEDLALNGAPGGATPSVPNNPGPNAPASPNPGETREESVAAQLAGN